MVFLGITILWSNGVDFAEIMLIILILYRQSLQWTDLKAAFKCFMISLLIDSDVQLDEA